MVPDSFSVSLFSKIAPGGVTTSDRRTISTEMVGAARWMALMLAHAKHKSNIPAKKREHWHVAELGQYAALPYVQLTGELRICLITSRETKRWVIPKGWPKANLRPHELAALEAVEEAGLLGEIAIEPIGTYSYRKQLPRSSSVVCEVAVFPLLVRAQQVHWREERERTLAWFSPMEAAQLVLEPDLGRLLAAMPEWARARSET